MSEDDDATRWAVEAMGPDGRIHTIHNREEWERLRAMSKEELSQEPAEEPTIEQQCAALVIELAKHGVRASYEFFSPMDMRTVGWLEAVTQCLIEIGPLTQERIHEHMWRNIRAHLADLLLQRETDEAAQPKPKPSDIVLARSLPKNLRGGPLGRKGHD